MSFSNALVSVIIPVYNAAESLADCLRSLKRQTYTSLELLFINDCSTDDSLAIISAHLADFELRGYTCQVISHAVNRGVAAARNSGLDAAQGTYICWLDADDYFIDTSISEMVAKIEEDQSDLVSFDWHLSFSENSRYMKQGDFQHPREGIMKMMLGEMRWNLWLFLVKRSLYEEHGIRFIPGQNMGEDLLVSMKLFGYASRVSYLNQSLYVYRQTNSQSLTKQYSTAHLEEVNNHVGKVHEFLKERAILGDSLAYYMHCLQLNIKLPLLVTGKRSSYRLWQSWFPASNRFGFKQEGISLRTRFLQYMAYRKQYWYVWLYYRLVFKLVYGLIYK